MEGGVAVAVAGRCGSGAEKLKYRKAAGEKSQARKLLIQQLYHHKPS
jgi:hypothetical protein